MGMRAMKRDPVGINRKLSSSWKSQEIVEGDCGNDGLDDYPSRRGIPNGAQCIYGISFDSSIMGHYMIFN